MRDRERFAIVITHVDRRESITEMPWLETEFRIGESDWVVLSEDGWRAVANGDGAIWGDLERKLLIGSYLNQPQLIVVIGHPSRDQCVEPEQRQGEVRQIAKRIRSMLLPAGVMGIWTDADGVLQDILEPAEQSPREAEELQSTS